MSLRKSYGFTSGPPTSSAVLVNLGNDLLITRRSVLTALAGRAAKIARGVLDLAFFRHSPFTGAIDDENGLVWIFAQR